MITTSAAFLEAAKALNRTPQARVIVNGVTYTNKDLTSVTVQSGSIVEENFQIGSVVSDSVTVEFPKIITTLRQLDDVVIEMGFNDEYVSLGHFKIYPNVLVSKNDHSTKFEAYDILSFMADPYSSSLNYPASAYNIMAEIANKYGVAIANANLLNELDGISEFRLPKLTGKYTNREVLGFVAGLVSGYIKINRNGALEIRRLPISGSAWNESINNSSVFEIRPDEYFLKGLEIQGKKFSVHGLSAKVSNGSTQAVITAGGKKGNVLDVTNPWVTQNLLNGMFEKVKNIAFYPFELNWRGNPAIEAGDVLSVYDIEGTKHFVPNLTYELTFNGGLRGQSSASTEAGNDTIANPPSLINRLKNDVNDALTKSTDALNSANGKNTNYYGEDEPSITPLSREGDLWFKKDGDKTEMWQLKMLNSILTWELVISEQSQEEFEKKLQKELDDTKTELGVALAENNTAMSNALSQLESVQGDVSSAVTQANDAVSKAESALANIDDALLQAQNAYAKSVKSSIVTYQVGLSGTTVPSGTWITSIPSVPTSQYLWTRTVFTLQDGTTTTSYSVSKQGENGTPGANAPTITKVQDQIYLSTSNTTQSGGAWGTSVPTWSSGKYYWTRVVMTLSDNSTNMSTPVLADGLNQSLITAFQAKTMTDSLQTTVSQHATAIELSASNVTNLGSRVTTAESTLAIQAGQISSKANQTTVDTLTGRVTIAENTITQSTESFNLLLSKQNKAINDLGGASFVQTEWQQGSINTSNGQDATSTSYVRSGFLDVVADKKYLLQTFEGLSATGQYGQAYIFYYKADKTLNNYVNYNANSPIAIPTNVRYVRLRFQVTISPTEVNCYLLQSDITNGYVNLSNISNVVKLTATTDALRLSVSETHDSIGVPFKVKQWQLGSLNTSDGSEISATSSLRSDFINVTAGEKYISQLTDGSAFTMTYHFYSYGMPYVDYVPIAKQYVQILTAGTYLNSTIADYLLNKSVENLSITGTVTTNPYTSSGDYLVIYKIPLEGKEAPTKITWSGRKDTSDNTVWLFSGGAWIQLGNVTSSSILVHEWELTDFQKNGISGDSVYLAFFSIKNGNYTGIYNNDVTPFTLNPTDANSMYQINYTSSSSAITVPVNCVKMRVRASTSLTPDAFQGNIYLTSVRENYANKMTLYSALLMTKDLINLRVGKGDLINQINISPESILIAGNKVQITGQTTIADAVIASAKIASLDAAKITTGTLNAARIAAGTITATHLSVSTLSAISANVGTLTSGTINASGVNVINLNAANITTGTLAAARIAARSITADKIAANTITASEIKSGAITADMITAGTMSANRINGGTITGTSLNSSTGGKYIKITAGDCKIDFYGAFGNATINQNLNGWNDTLLNKGVLGTNGSFYVNNDLHVAGALWVNSIHPTSSDGAGITNIFSSMTISGKAGMFFGAANISNGIWIGGGGLYLIYNNSAYDVKTILQGGTWNV
ncbi:autotransporter outer membrane beta-barrel domain-containing protein [Pseudolactococcus reticulitermitis]|uniref:Prophage tail endopeptidase domain-containing protein n=1 Tax=Pseudolactococcus reticulitermitis TaxID=2025039 RepID=A0A224X9Y9_9LACT|nr:hypothetical protein [Lactococcus reticulitermitis]GAX46762.1 hypothetical protein RsY01_341 [Lactococcus reticulitermitis]